MKNTLRYRIIGSLLALAGAAAMFPPPAAAQIVMTQTTLSSAVNGPGATTAPSQSVVSLASATGVNVGTNGPITDLYVDGEVMQVLSLVTGQTTMFNVLRGQMSTPVEGHASGAIVFVVTGSPTNGGLGYGGLQQRDPDVAANCTPTNQAYNLYINVLTGQQWECQAQYNALGTSINTWIPVTQYRTSAINAVLSLYAPQGTAYTNATTSYTSVPGLAFYAQPYHNYHMECTIVWKASANTAGPNYKITGPSSPTASAVGAWFNVTSSTYSTAVAALGTAVTNGGTVTTSTDFPDKLSLTLVNGANAGTVQVTAAANGTGTLTIEKGSACTVQ